MNMNKVKKKKKRTDRTPSLPLCPPASASQKAVPSVAATLAEILKKIPKSKRFSSLEWDKAPRSRIRVALGVPFVYRLYRLKRAQYIKAKYENVL